MKADKEGYFENVLFRTQVRLYKSRLSEFSKYFFEEYAPGMLGVREGRESIDMHIERVSDFALSECNKKTAKIIAEAEAVEKENQKKGDRLDQILQTLQVKIDAVR